MLKEINKIIQKPIERKVFLHEITLDINEQYFIDQIEKKLLEQNLNYKTNVKGKMTLWNAFVNDENFINVLDYGLKCTKEHIKYKPVFLKNAWGIKIEKNDFTQKHNHDSALYSGILYLNDVKQELEFPDLQICIKPKKGTFVTFSAWLDHYTKINKSDVAKYAIPFNLYYLEGEV